MARRQYGPRPGPQLLDESSSDRMFAVAWNRVLTDANPLAQDANVCVNQIGPAATDEQLAKHALTLLEHALTGRGCC